MAVDEPTNAQLKSMFRHVKVSTNAATQLITGTCIDSINEIQTLTQYRVTRLCLIIHNPGGGTNGHVVSESDENLFYLLMYY